MKNIFIRNIYKKECL